MWRRMKTQYLWDNEPDTLDCLDRAGGDAVPGVHGKRRTLRDSGRDDGDSPSDELDPPATLFAHLGSRHHVQTVIRSHSLIMQVLHTI
jgi:hypothetical protein